MSDTRHGATGTPASPPSAVAAPRKLGRYELGKIEGAELITDPSRFPRTFKEAAGLAALVQEGKLPPVAERIGQDPLVLKPVHSVGKYGGTLRRGFITSGRSTPDEEYEASGPDGLLWWDYKCSKVVPNIARGFELSSDAKTLTIRLRRGMRWSDGAPFTADDILFWYEDMYLNNQIVPGPHRTLLINFKPVVIEKADTETIRFVSPEPYPLLPEILATRGALSGQASAWGGANGMGGYAPKHYLSRFHPRYAPGGQAAVDRMAADAGFSNWGAFFKARNDWAVNADLPVLTPWKAVKGKEITTRNFVLERNPYSIWVDTDGNQLPYIDRISMSAAESNEIVNLRATAGEYDFQANRLRAENLAAIKEGEKQGGYEVHLSPELTNVVSIRLNLAYEADHVIGDLIRTADFRRALALGIDREQISAAFFQGMSAPNTIAPRKAHDQFPGTEYQTLWATKDVETANRMLDALGLDTRDAEGYRQRKDGRRLRLEATCMVSKHDFPAIAEMIGQQWKQIGVDLTVNIVSGALAMERANTNQVQLTVFATGSENLFVYPDEVFPCSMDGFSGSFGPPHIRWFQTGGTEGKEPPARMREVMELWRKGFQASEAERTAIAKEIYRIIVEEAFVVGLLGSGIGSYGFYIAKTNLGNVPASVWNAGTAPLNTFPMTFYFK